MKFNDLLKQNRNRITELLINPETNRKITGLATYSVLAVVSLVMTVLNIITEKGVLTVATGVFGALCLLNLLVAFFGKQLGTKVASACFALQLVALFTFFLISGNPDGFSAIWICLVPLCGMLFFSMRNGSILCFAMLAELIWFLWLPWGQSMLLYDYNETFRMRFPLLYGAFLALAICLQYFREITWQQLLRANSRIHEEAAHDQLTGLHNRQGFFDAIDHAYSETPASVGVAIFDVDFFKSVNDTYGHTTGDYVLKEFANLVKSNLNAECCRWGGEEFAAFYTNDNVKKEDFDNLLRVIETHVFVCEGHQIRLTTSIGVAESSVIHREQITALIQQADQALYHSKETGRNRVSYFI